MEGQWHQEAEEEERWKVVQGRHLSIESMGNFIGTKLDRSQWQQEQGTGREMKERGCPLCCY